MSHTLALSFLLDACHCELSRSPTFRFGQLSLNRASSWQHGHSLKIGFSSDSDFPRSWSRSPQNVFLACFFSPLSCESDTQFLGIIVSLLGEPSRVLRSHCWITFALASLSFYLDYSFYTNRSFIKWKYIHRRLRAPGRRPISCWATLLLRVSVNCRRHGISEILLPSCLEGGAE